MGPQIAFLGMGGMAKAMTKNLVQYANLDKPLILYNRTQSTAEEHSQTIGYSNVVSTPSEAIDQADIIWSCLQDEVAVDATFSEGLTSSVQGKLFVDSSSIPPEQTKLIAQKVISLGGEFVSMPVMGEPSMADRRLLHCIAAGSKQSLDRIRPYVVGVVGQSMIDLVDEPPEQASLLKLMGNVLILLTMETVAEVNVFAEKCGLGVANMQKLMSEMFPNPPHAIYNHRMVNGGYYQDQPMVEVYKARKLASHVTDLARAAKASIPGYEVATRHLEVAEAHAGPSVDITGIYGAVRIESDLPFKNGGKDEQEK